MFEVTLSHQLPNGTKKYKAPTIEDAKRLGDAQFFDVKIPGGRNGAAPFRIIVLDGGVEIASRELPAGEWKDAPTSFKEWPKWVTPEGREPIIVNSREKEAALAPPHGAARDNRGPRNSEAPAAIQGCIVSAKLGCFRVLFMVRYVARFAAVVKLRTARDRVI